MSSRRLARELEAELAREDLDDIGLLATMEALAERQPAFGLLTGLWGPALYRRHRALFRGFILRRFRSAGYDPGRGAWRSAPWHGEYEEELERWLQLAESLEDAEMFRRLYRWRLSDGEPIGPRAVGRWRGELCAHFVDARGRGARLRVLERYDQPFELNEASARCLYEADAEAARDYIAARLARVPVHRRRLWIQMRREARRRGDWPFARELYRLQVSPAQWRRDVEAMAHHVGDPSELVGWLEEHHPQGMFEEKGEVFLMLVRTRQVDVMPYVRRHLGEVFRGVGSAAVMRAFLDEMARRNWWGVWAQVLRQWSSQPAYEREVVGLLHDHELADRSRRRRLQLLGRVGDEAEVHPLSDATAVALYDRYPGLVRGVFAERVMPTAVQGYSRLLARAMEANDRELIDRMAARQLTETPRFGVVEVVRTMERLTQYYRGELDAPRAFAKRAVRILSGLDAEVRWRPGRLLEKNPLARLFLVEALPAYLLDEAWIGALLRAPAWYVRRAACEALCLGEEQLAGRRARQCVRQAMPGLGGRHRAERRWAARAVARGVADAESARDAIWVAQAVLETETLGGRVDGELVRLIAILSERWPRAAHQAAHWTGPGPARG
ncbi:hypothetical protein DL240_11310 [Lujinxingia litoralis]|uniref:Uncharacterized protein n=1 Tax=Lujinxingia litoralis TaxID=2211119 RepID=A0A328CB37_9DELT|nr:hypothetical protein [Lujinxingia litoralis]RAL22427.1 hypothetical protein DL240_11310 [Lujinxingia litoralis]